MLSMGTAYFPMGLQKNGGIGAGVVEWAVPGDSEVRMFRRKQKVHSWDHPRSGTLNNFPLRGLLI